MQDRVRNRNPDPGSKNKYSYMYPVEWRFNYSTPSTAPRIRIPCYVNPCPNPVSKNEIAHYDAWYYGSSIRLRIWWHDKLINQPLSIALWIRIPYHAAPKQKLLIIMRVLDRIRDPKTKRHYPLSCVSGSGSGIQRPACSYGFVTDSGSGKMIN